MERTASSGRRIRVVLPSLAVLLAVAASIATYALCTFRDLEEAQERSGVMSDLLTSVRVRMNEARARSRAIRGGELTLAPTNQAEVRAVAEFCQSATGTDLAVLRRAALQAESPLAAAHAVRALGRMRAVARDPEVVALLRTGRERVRDETILALGESRDREAVALLDPLATGAEPKARLLAIRALGRVGGEDARRTLREVLEGASSTREDRAFARAALAPIALAR